MKTSAPRADAPDGIRAEHLMYISLEFSDAVNFGG
jgi:hypothetical protein